MYAYLRKTNWNLHLSRGQVLKNYNLDDFVEMDIQPKIAHSKTSVKNKYEKAVSQVWRTNL